MAEEPEREGGRSGAPLRPAPATSGGASSGAPGASSRRGSPAALLTLVLVIATAGLVYELSIAAVASYLLGDSIREFSLVIGAYLSALGVGAYLSRYVDRRLAVVFVDVELSAALVGGLSVPGLLVAFATTHAFQLVLFGTAGAIGILVGIELPLLIRLLERRIELRELVARALTADYAGALLGSVAFSLVLVPKLGLSHTSVACGLLNAAAGLAATWLLPASDAAEARDLGRARGRAVLVVLALGAALSVAGKAADLSEAAVHPGALLVARESPYQRIVLTDHDGALELFLNGNLQFSSRDEYRYHEALVHPAMAAAGSRQRVVVGGGGDGLAVREILRWPGVDSVTVVDLDPAVTDLARSFPRLVALNGAALRDPRVHVENQDAMRWFGEPHEDADVIVLDFPDPGTYAVGKLYTTAFYARVRRHLAKGGALVVQASSPGLAPETFSCIVRTVEASGFSVRPYRAFVPSFGMWGFVLAKTEPFDAPRALPPAPLRFLDGPALGALFSAPPPRARVGTVNRLDNQALVAHYLTEWGRWDGR